MIGATRRLRTKRRGGSHSIAEACIAAALLGGFAVSASAQEYPAKPVRIVLPFLGGTEFIGRMLATKLSTALGQQVVPDPRIGAAGNIGYLAAAKAAPDGYTIVMGAVPVVTNPHINPKSGFDPIRDFAPVALVATIPNILVVHPSVPATTLGDLLRIARASPGRIAYGSGGVGSANHLAAEFLQSAAGVKFTHVPYKSATLGLVGAMSGEVDVVIVVTSSATGYIRSGRMRPLALLDKKRVASLPQVPTTAEAGLPDLVAVNWYAVLAPAGTPAAIVDRLNAESVKAMNAPDYRAPLAEMGAEPSAFGAAETGQFLRAEYARWGKVIREAGLGAGTAR